MREVSLGIITSPVGLSGHFKCSLYSNPPSWKFAYVTLGQEKKKLEIVSWPYSSKRNVCKCKLEGVSSRNQVGELIGKKVWLYRDELPPIKEDEVYFYDLIGSEVISSSGVLGVFTDVYDFGAGEVLRLEILNHSVNQQKQEWNHNNPNNTRFSSELNLETGNRDIKQKRNKNSINNLKLKEVYIHWTSVDKIIDNKIYLKDEIEII